MEREGIFSRLKILYLKAFSGSYIGVESQLKYNQAFTFTDPQSVPDLATIMAILGSGISMSTFDENDLIPDTFGGFMLPFAVSSPNIPLMVRIETASDNKNLNINFANDNLYGFDDPTLGTQTIYVYSTGAYTPPAPPPPAPVFSLQPTTPLTIIQNNTLNLSVLASDTTSYQWYKNGVALSDNFQINGSSTSTLNVDFFGSVDAGTYKCVAVGGGGSTDSANSIVSYDAGIYIINLSNQKSDGTPNGVGRNITYDDGNVIRTLVPNQADRFSTSSTSLDIKQAGSDDLTLFDGVHTFSPIVGGSVSNVYVPPFGVLEIYNDN